MQRRVALAHDLLDPGERDLRVYEMPERRAGGWRVVLARVPHEHDLLHPERIGDPQQALRIGVGHHRRLVDDEPPALPLPPLLGGGSGAGLGEPPVARRHPGENGGLGSRLLGQVGFRRMARGHPKEAEAPLFGRPNHHLEQGGLADPGCAVHGDDAVAAGQDQRCGRGLPGVEGIDVPRPKHRVRRDPLQPGPLGKEGACFAQTPPHALDDLAFHRERVRRGDAAEHGRIGGPDLALLDQAVELAFQATNRDSGRRLQRLGEHLMAGEHRTPGLVHLQPVGDGGASGQVLRLRRIRRSEAVGIAPGVEPVRDGCGDAGELRGDQADATLAPLGDVAAGAAEFRPGGDLAG